MTTIARRAVALTAGCLVVGVAVSVGWAQPLPAIGLLAGAVAPPAAIALVGVVCWLTLGVITTMVAGAVLRQRRPMRAGRPRVLLLVVASVLLLAAGVIRHASTFTVCCASPAGAQEAQHDVP